MISIAKDNNLYINKADWDKFGNRRMIPTGESVVFLSKDGNVFTKMKSPFSKVPLKQTHPEDIIYEHLIHNILFPNTRYRFIGISDVLIDSIKADDGILLHLSTEEYEHLFDWKRVCKEVTVVQPLFYVRQKDGRLKMQAVWAKSCRGAMVRFVLNNSLVSPEELSAFSYEDFEYAPQLGDANNPHFVREII